MQVLQHCSRISYQCHRPVSYQFQYAGFATLQQPSILKTAGYGIKPRQAIVAESTQVLQHCVVIDSEDKGFSKTSLCVVRAAQHSSNSQALQVLQHCMRMQVCNIAFRMQVLQHY